MHVSDKVVLQEVLPSMFKYQYALVFPSHSFT